MTAWPRALSAEQRAQRYARVAELTAAGWTAPAIAKEMGTTVRTVVRARAATGCRVRPPLPQLTDDQIARAKALLEDGASYYDVAETVGCGISTLRARFPGYSWTMREAGQYRAALHHAANASWHLAKMGAPRGLIAQITDRAAQFEAEGD